ncbi:hypothetical protein LPJ70_000664 [Coemansia sp. RSA 2708]|nr:hypothetical protein LPJ70_000664 [Coemansia sp. RSA 2708]
MEAWYAELYIKPIQHPAPTFDRSVAKIASLVDRSADIEGAEAAVLRLTANVLQTSASIGDVFDSGNDDSDDSGTLQDKDSHDFAGIRRQAAALVAGNADGRRSWQLHECQLQILLHLLIIDRIRLWKLDKRIEAGRLTETLSDLVDQLCIWASVDDIFCSAPSGSASTNADNGSSAGDIAAVFIGSSLVGQFTERLGDIVDELRVQCGWVPAADRDDSGQSGELENKRRKGTLRKITASQSERSEVIVQQGKQKPQVMSGRKLARHLEELISSKRRLSRNSNNEPPRPDTGSASERRRSTQLKLPLQLIRQLKNEVVSVRSAPLSRARTINSRSNSSGSMRWGGRNNGTIGATKNSTMNCSRVRAPARRQPIPEFELSSSPSISGRVKEMHLVPETPSKKRQRTGDPVPASSPLFIPSEAPAANAFIYESEDSDVAERSPLFGRTMAGQTCQQPGAGHLQGQGSHRVLRFPDQGH